MTEISFQPRPPDTDAEIRGRILARAGAINGELLKRLASVSDDLDAGRHLAALGGLDGLEREITTMRSILLLLEL